MSVELLELAATALGPLTDRVAFLGGASLVLWMSDPAAPPVRPTKDVDVIVEVGSLVQYYGLGDQLRARGFEEDPSRGVICAWRHSPSDLRLDVMPTEPGILGFANHWHAPALKAALPVKLPSGRTIRAVPPPHLLATKIAAFRGRGNNDYLASADFGDIVALIDGRPELLTEVAAAERNLSGYVSTELAQMTRDPLFESGVAGALPPDAGAQGRRPTIIERVTTLIGSNGEREPGICV